jgi:hypothetical protein
VDDRWVGEWMDGCCMGGWIDEQMDRWMNESMC